MTIDLTRAVSATLFGLILRATAHAHGGSAGDVSITHPRAGQSRTGRSDPNGGHDANGETGLKLNEEFPSAMPSSAGCTPPCAGIYIDGPGHVGARAFGARESVKSGSGLSA
jgi:hypothetical protein